jgi:threonine/homoserine/homoserine lactone efflux protein
LPQALKKYFCTNIYKKILSLRLYNCLNFKKTMSNALLSGISMGLILAALIGPIFFTLIQTAIERGFRAGMTVALGEWVSDIAFIAATYYGMTWLNEHLDQDLFKYYIGMLGGVVLILFGASSLLTKIKLNTEVEPINARTLSGFFLKGLAINSINPFTFIFWITTTGAYVIKKNLNLFDAMLFYGGIIGTIAFFDILKIWAAKKLRAHLQPVHITLMRRIAGIALIISGLILIGRIV